METKKDIAIKLFLQGFNCAQSIAGAFHQEMNVDFDTAVKLSSGFGAGMGKLREVCGVVSGMTMVLSMVSGYSQPDASDEKAELYKKIQELAESFKEKNNTIICRELLKNIKTTNGHTPQERNSEYYKVRPCAKFVGDGAEILEEYLREL